MNSILFKYNEWFFISNSFNCRIMSSTNVNDLMLPKLPEKLPFSLNLVNFKEWEEELRKTLRNCYLEHILDTQIPSFYSKGIMSDEAHEVWSVDCKRVSRLMANSIPVQWKGKFSNYFPDMMLKALEDVVNLRVTKSTRGNYDGLVEDVTRSLSNMRIKPPQDGCLIKERQEVWAKVYNARLRPGMPLQAHVLNMTRLFTHLELIGKPVDDEQAALMLLSSLHSGYVALKMRLTAKRNKLSLMEVVQELQKTYSCKKAKVALRPKKKEFKNKAKMRCFYCSRPGHYKRECSMYLEDEAKGKVTSISGIIFTLEHKPFIRY